MQWVLSVDIFRPFTRVRRPNQRFAKQLHGHAELAAVDFLSVPLRNLAALREGILSI